MIRILPLASMLLVLSGAVLAAPSPIKNAKALEREQKKVEKKLLKASLKFVKQLEKDGQDHYARLEALRALRLDPDNKKFQKYVPEDEPPPPIKIPDYYEELKAQLLAVGSEELGEVFVRAKEGGVEAEALASFARRVLEFDPDHAGARAALGFVGAKGKWATARQAAVAEAYAKAWKECPEPKQMETHPWTNLEKALGLKLVAFEGEHCYAAGNAAAPKPDQLQTIVKAADVALAAFLHDLLGMETIFWSPEQRTKATGIELGKFSKPLFLLLDDRKQHVTFLENCVEDPNLKVSGRGLGFVNYGYAPDRVIICEGWQPERYLKEWPSQRMAIMLTNQLFGPRRPYYVIMGISRYYSGHISGQSQIRMVPTGSKTEGNGASRQTGDYFQLRSLCRWSYNECTFNPPLASGMFRTVDSMRRPDNAVANAFVDYLLAKDRGKLLQLLTDGDSQVRQGAELIKHVFGDDPAAVDRAFLEWMLENY